MVASKNPTKKAHAARLASPALAVAGLSGLIASQWPDIRRYIKIKQLSAGSGHPEQVPAHGRISYPH